MQALVHIISHEILHKYCRQKCYNQTLLNHVTCIEFLEFGEKVVHFGLFLMRLSPMTGMAWGKTWQLDNTEYTP